MISVADYIANTVYEAGAHTAFIVTGGFSMNLTDAIGRHGRMKYVCTHHEQAGAMAAEAFGRFTQTLGACFTTTGPAALNALNGVAGAWCDSVPMIVISGQAKLAQAQVTGCRQFPVQGLRTLPIYEHVTKFSAMLERAEDLPFLLGKAIHIAMHGRPGPVWIEIPLDIQNVKFDPAECRKFEAPRNEQETETPQLRARVIQVLELLRSARRPCLLAGAGIRHAKGIAEFHYLLNVLNIPFLTARLGMDLVDNEHPLLVGRPGTYGDRPANFTVQNADLLITIGCRLGIGMIGHDFSDFARHAKKVIVDVDPTELSKPSIVPDLAIQADAKLFCKILAEEAQAQGWKFSHEAWLQTTRSWRQKYPVDLPEYQQEKDGVNMYHFTRVFSELLAKDSVTVLDTGGCFHVWGQACKVKFGQRHVITGGLSTMGYGLPGAIGIAAATKGMKDVICITGDGSIQMNLQELQTIVHHKYPVKIIVFDNKGYLLIRLSQRNFLEGRLLGEGPESGVSFPDPRKIAEAYGLKFLEITEISHMKERISEALEWRGPVWLNVKCPQWQLLIPRVASEKMPDGTMRSKPYDDMFPFLPRDEYEANCVRKSWL